MNKNACKIGQEITM